jgi:hypothetical protein
MIINNFTAQRIADLLDLSIPVRAVYRNTFGLRALKDLTERDQVEGLITMRDSGIVLIPVWLSTQAEIDLSNRMIETWRNLAEQGSGLHLKLLAILSGL